MKIVGTEIKLPEDREAQYRRKDGWETKRLKHMKANLHNGDLMFYVGAEMGEMPALCQMWGAEVVLFEPNPQAWQDIYALWEANKLDPPMGLFRGFACNNDMMIDEIDWAWDKIPFTDVEGEHGFKELYIEAENYNQTKIDTMTKLIRHPTAISIDVEGSEFEVLKGARWTLQTYKPKVWLSLHPEFLFSQWEVYAGEVRGWMKELGYKETLLDYQHEVHLFYD